MATFMEPDCATVSATAATTSGATIGLTGNQVIAVPPTGITSLTVSAIARAQCNDQYIAMVLAVVYAPKPLPVVPSSSCPCWSVPSSGGNCGGIQQPIYLTTEVS